MALARRIRSWARAREVVVWLEYGVLALAVMLPLLRPGYVFALDMVLTPKIRFPEEITHAFPLGVTMHLLTYAMPSYWVQKLLMLAVLLLAGVGMHRLIRSDSEWPKYFAGILYMFNPFVFQRFTAGQVGLLLGYAITPFAMNALLAFLEEPRLRSALTLTVLTLVVFAVDLHAGALVLFVYAVASFFSVLANRGRSTWARSVLGYGVAAILLFVLVSTYWLVPFFAGGSSQAQVVRGFDRRHVVGFKPVADPKMGILFNVAAMYGFWGEGTERFIAPKAVIPGWPAVFLLLLVVVVAGLGLGVRDKLSRWYALTFAAVGGVAFVLAVGVAHPITAPIFWFLIRRVPLFVGFRDSQKFVALVVLSYAYLGAFAVRGVHKWCAGLKRASNLAGVMAAVLLMALPLLYTCPMLWGFGGHLKVTPDYPRDWYQVNDFLNRDPSDSRVLFLPWHQYMHFTFAGKVIANPAREFFDKPVIRGNNMEFGEIYTQESNPTSVYIENTFVTPAPEVHSMGRKLAPLKVKYVILAKEADYPRYGYLDDQEDLELIMDTDTLDVYRNKVLQR